MPGGATSYRGTDRCGDPSCGERAQEERVAALEGETKPLAGLSERCRQADGDDRAAAGRGAESSTSTPGMLGEAIAAELRRER
jgi:hypothetical protein